jgi:hypothetical protein
MKKFNNLKKCGCRSAIIPEIADFFFMKFLDIKAAQDLKKLAKVERMFC